MRALKVFATLFIVMLVQLIPAYLCLASPSGNLYYQGSDIFDEWHVFRTTPSGEDGYLGEIYASPRWPPESIRPVIIFESLGEWSDTAYDLGGEFAEKYPDIHQRAEQIFYFVRDRVRYVLDSDQFGVSEFAQNADELANAILEDGRSFGDCEDMAILLVVMYRGAGLRSAIVDCPGHVGAMVYLPDYRRANVLFELDGESGWVWAEATGNTNPFGWFPQGQIDGPLLAHEISAEPISLWEQPTDEPPPETAVIEGGSDLASTGSLFSVVVALLFIIGIMMFTVRLVRRLRA
jgi:hypothetical protein